MSQLSHLDALEAEAIYIIREVAAECEKPVMLYSIGKDSSVMLTIECSKHNGKYDCCHNRLQKGPDNSQVRSSVF